jgi:hypothetical protein
MSQAAGVESDPIESSEDDSASLPPQGASGPTEGSRKRPLPPNSLLPIMGVQVRPFQKVGRFAEAQGLRVTVWLHPHGLTDVTCDANPGITECLLKPLGFTWIKTLQRWRHDMSKPPPAFPLDPVEEVRATRAPSPKYDDDHMCMRVVGRVLPRAAT